LINLNLSLTLDWDGAAGIRRPPAIPEISGGIKAANYSIHFLKSDNYNSYKHPDNWIRFEYPFWWNNLAAALDSVSLIGIPPPTRMSGEPWTGSCQSDGDRPVENFLF